MREIKFRAWHKKLKQMIEVCSINFLLEEIYDKDMIDCWYLPECELLQYTGLCCYAGKPIYEGDILQWPADKEIAVVKYRLAYSGFRLASSPDPNYMDSSIGLNIGDKGMATVIGNIYETPELLTCEY